MVIRNPRSITVYANKDIRKRTIDLCFTRGEGTASESFAKPMEFVEPPEKFEETAGHTVSLPFEDASQLMNELWAAGIRPTEDMGSTGQLSAMKEVVAAKNAHVTSLEAEVDYLRRLLNHQLGIVP